MQGGYQIKWRGGGWGWKIIFWVLSTLVVYNVHHSFFSLEYDEENVLKESETIIFDKNLLKAYDSTVSMYRETHFRLFAPYLLNCIKCFPANLDHH